ncbi:MAG: hypothetical protein BYD32DRAFT_416544, partial [Podila humilis]
MRFPFVRLPIVCVLWYVGSGGFVQKKYEIAKIEQDKDTQMGKKKEYYDQGCCLRRFFFFFFRQEKIRQPWQTKKKRTKM